MPLRPTASEPSLFSLKPLSSRLPAPARPVGAVARPVLERALKLHTLNRDYNLVSRRSVDEGEAALDFAEATLNHYGISVATSAGDLERIPKTGPVIVVSNHPFGGLEGLMMLMILRKVRPDVKLLANFLLARVPEMKPDCFFVDPFGGANSQKNNRQGLTDSARWLREGHVLGVFPAGEVSALRWSSRGRVKDPAWSAHVASMARRNKAQVVPMHIKGTNSALFQIAGLVHPKLRTALLPREFQNKRDRLVRIRLGTAVSSQRMQSFPNDQKAIDYLRLRSDLLGLRRRLTAKQRKRESLSTRRHRGQSPAVSPIVDPSDPARIIAEINALPPSNLLVDDKGYSVFSIRAAEAPTVMREVGRLREVTFRAVGEGSGKDIDLDRFDDWYHHLILWNKADQRIAGAYRMGRAAEILPKHGVDGLYVQTLFDLQPGFLNEVGDQLVETGRSFVRMEYQRSFAPLLNLWRGICAFMDHHGDRYIMGPVSISNSYCKLSKALIVRRLMSGAHRSELAGFVAPRFPFSMRRYGRARVMRLARAAVDLQELSHVISDIEPDGKGFPILLRQYLSWDAKALGVNVDPDFNYCVDCLYLVDMPAAPDRTVNRYFGKDRMKPYRAKFGL